MKTILFALDFSPASQPAMTWAKLLVRQYQAELILVHVASVPMPNTTLPAVGGAGLGMGMMMGAAMPLDTQPVFEDQLNELGQQLLAEGIRCRTDLRRGGIDEAILDAAQEYRADLIITGRSHIGNFFDRLAGTVASDIASGAPCPVLIVPSTIDDSDESAGPATDVTQPGVSLRTIVFSTPLEFEETDVFRQVVNLARTVGASVRLLRVMAENQPNIVADSEIFGPLQSVYGTEPLVVDTVEASTVTGGIDDYLSENAVDLLVMTTRERSFLSGLLNPSLTGKMVVRSDVPLLVYQAEGDL